MNGKRVIKVQFEKKSNSLFTWELGSFLKAYNIWKSRTKRLVLVYPKYILFFVFQGTQKSKRCFAVPRYIYLIETDITDVKAST